MQLSHLRHVLSFSYTFFLVPFVHFNHVDALAKTDTITWGGSNDRTGYQSNHNMDPAIVGSAQFGQLFRTKLPGVFSTKDQSVPEQIFSQPLVYTDANGTQYVYIATTQNNIYKMNAKTGVIVASRNLHRPFLISDLDGCSDISPTIGVIGTGVIDPDTDIWYLTSKTYLDQNINGDNGKSNGRYYFHAINTNDLSERPNFPIGIEGIPARNNPLRTFGAGIHLQRPGLLHVDQYVYAGFASHCAQYNFTGWIIGWDKSTGQIVERFATQGAGVAANTPGAGVWMSGGGLASDDKGSIFFATGNGYASQLNGVPVNGRNPPTALEEAAVHMAINENGTLNVVDFFMPWEKTQLDGADKDLGTSPLEILPSQFQCGNITRMGVVTGKSGKTYWLNLDNLGGYQNGPNKQDNVIQVYQNENSVYAGAGVYPLEGGYIYINVIQYPSHVFKFSCNNGMASFNKIADSPSNNAYVLGVGHGTTTSLDGQPGTGLLWTSDVEGSNLRIYNAVPNNGYLTQINSFTVPGTTKFTRPVFGDGVVYQGTTQGYIYAFGAPVSLPMNCTTMQFGTININATSAPMTLQCQANTAFVLTNVSVAGNPNFVLSGLPTLPFQIASGQNVSFQVRFTPQAVGPLSSSVILNTTQDKSFATNTPIQLRGVGQSQEALLSVAPNTISWNGVITGQDVQGVNQSVLISNFGNSLLSISEIRYSLVSRTGPWINSNGSRSATVVSAFTFYDMPTSIQPNSAVTVPINFKPTKSASYALYVQVISTGGTKNFDVFASANEYPRALLEFETLNGGWVLYDNNTTFSFGNVTENTSRYLRLRLSNNSTASSAALSITVSKPPFGVPGSIIGTSNQVDLGEGTFVQPGQSMTAVIYCSVPKSQINVDPYNSTVHWTINLNDPTFGKRQVQFSCNAVSEQAAPLDSITQQALYRYAGCFRENNPTRQLQTQIYASGSNTNEMCIAKCSASGFIFAGTQYNQQCWCGYNRPKTIVNEANCNFPCTGDVNEVCGGNGIDGAGAYISLFGDITRWNGNTTDAPGPYVNPGAFGYRSIGCFTEGSGTRALPLAPSSNSTVLSCLSACNGYAYAGIEYGGQCYCGNTLGSGSVSTSASDCSMTCNNNQTEFCGGPSRLNMYIYGNGTVPSSTTSTITTGTTNTAPTGLTIPAKIGKYTYMSCYTEGSSGRALSGYALANDTMTLQICAGVCSAYQYFGMEYGRECYCGNTLGTGSVPATDGRCSMSCAGNSNMACGGPSGLQLYKQGPSSSSSSSTTTSTTLNSVGGISITTSSTISTTTALNTGPTNPPFVQSFKYVDCYTEANGARALAGKTVVSNDMTLDFCSGNCTGFAYMAVEYGSECYCGNSLGSGSIPATDGRCSMTCPGNTGTFCGGPNGLSLYRYLVSANTTTSISATTTSTTTSTTGTTLTSTTRFVSLTRSTVYTNSCTLIIASTTSTQSGTTSISTTSTYVTTSAPSLSTTTTAFISTSPVTTVLRSSTLSSTTSVFSIQINSTATASTTSSLTPYVSTSSLTPISTLTVPSLTTTSATTRSNSSLASVTNNTSDVPPTSTLKSSTTLFTTTLSTIRTTSLITFTSSVSSSATTSPRYTYLGCAAETNPRALPVTSFTSPNMTISLCQSFCSSRSPPLPLSGLEYSRECWCGYNLSPSSNSSLSSSTGDAGCNMPCAGNSSQICGGNNKLSIWRDETWRAPVLKPLISINTTNDGNNNNTTIQYNYQGCYTDSLPRRTLSSYSFISSNAMTQELCILTCSARGYRFAGVEYAQECYCGEEIWLGSASTTNKKVDDAECMAMLCKGDNTEWCGNGGRIGVWARV